MLKGHAAWQRRWPKPLLFASALFGAWALFIACHRTPESHKPSLVFATSNDFRSGFMKRADGRIVPVKYAYVNGRAIFEGDIVIGEAAELERLAERVRTTTGGPIHIEGFGTIGAGGRWAGNTVPYCISPGLSNPARVARAAAEWNAKTTMHIRDAGAICNIVAVVFNHVNFVEGGECSSPVGQQGGSQNITLAPDCNDGAVIHELGHAVGLWHEQSRPDRDNYVTIIFNNIPANQQHNFNQESGTLLGAYDFNSIMHYGAYDFAINRANPTIVTKPPGIPIGQRNGLSAGDVAAVRMLYP